MTVLYRFLKTFVSPIAKSFFGEVRAVNYQNVPEGEPILFVANHPSALMDPVICGSFINVPIFFLGRADIFNTKFNNWFLRNAHMWPIYRDVDGKDSLEKNKQVFAECYASLKEGNPILLYGEGFTDETFIRRVKKIKKGAARIAFGAESDYNFQMGLKIVPIGINYTDPTKLDSDLMMRYAEPIEIKDYEDLYRDNAVKAMLEVTREIEKKILEETIHIKNKKYSDSFEQVLMLFENSVHYDTRSQAIDFEKRWKQSKELADGFNNWEDVESKEEYLGKVESFWKKLNTGDSSAYLIKCLNGNKVTPIKEVIELIFGLPFALLGVTLSFPVFLLLSILPIKLVKRICFHSGMKVAMSVVLFPLIVFFEYLIALFFVDFPLLYLNMLFGAIVFGRYSLRYRMVFNRLKKKLKAKKILSKITNLSEVKEEYKNLKNIAQSYGGNY